MAPKPVDPTRIGYGFDGWYYDSGLTQEVTWPLKLENDRTLYAKWTAIEYTITYELDGGINGANPGTFTITDLPVTLEDATKELNTFGGWYLEAEFTNEVEEISTIGNITIYAKFTTT
jgi:uncharacterized repeat protein (TIGR02543 family)